MRVPAVVLAFASVQLAAFAALPPIPTAVPGDRLLMVASRSVFEASLPRGPAELTVSLTERVDALAVTPDGRLLAVQRSIVAPPMTRLLEIGEAGLVAIGELDLSTQEELLDLAFDSEGRLYLLTETLKFWNPPETINRLIEIDPETADIVSQLELFSDLAALAPAPRGLWALTFNGLFRLDPASGALWDTGIEATATYLAPLAADTDASGALWILTTNTVVSPPIQEVMRLDPVTGSSRSASFAIPQAAGSLAVHRQCEPTATARCLQGGRFLVEVEWEDFAGQTGSGRVAPSASADSALFWFFDPANWEILVKVLDGCGTNGHFWVFAAATTNVAYTLTVIDLETGQTHVVENFLGEAMPATTDTTAFACP